MPPHESAADRSAPKRPTEMTRSQIEHLEAMYGNRYLLEPRARATGCPRPA